jgi:hypothetical protein
VTTDPSRKQQQQGTSGCVPHDTKWCPLMPSFEAAVGVITLLSPPQNEAFLFSNLGGTL